MSVIFEINDCKLIENQQAIDTCLDNGLEVKFKFKNLIFMNFKRKEKSLKNQKVNEEIELKERIKSFLTDCKVKNLFQQYLEDDIEQYKQKNVELMNKFYNSSTSFSEFHGENNLNIGVITTINNTKFIIPPKCKFFNKNINDINNFLSTSEKFDIIIMDPPWANRYIKRLKKTNKSQSYQMMSDDDIMRIPIENYTHNSSVVVIWCTNSSTHQAAVEQKFLPKWNLKIEAKWKWIKIDKCGELFCSCEGSKKPYETIFICSHAESHIPRDSILRDALIFSHPSSIHSHKPQLKGIHTSFILNRNIKLRKNYITELFSHVLPSSSKCLEIFARSLYSNFTSIGMEVLRLQNILLFDKINSPTCPTLSKV